MEASSPLRFSVLSRVRDAIQRYVHENFDDLLRQDMHLARVLGAPAPHTLSSYAYRLELEGKFWGKFWRPIIDVVYGSWIMGQTNHCKQDYERVNGETKPNEPISGTTDQSSRSEPH